MRVSQIFVCLFLLSSHLSAIDKCCWMRNDACDLKILVLPPISAEGAALFTYKNNSNQDDESIFLQVVGVNPQSGNQCFISYDTGGNPSYYDVTDICDSQKFSYPLSNFPQNNTTSGRFIYLPKLEGARLYTSIDEKMIFSVVKNAQGIWTICAPNPLNPQDPNISILWDKTEFAVDDNTVFINPTAVDNFSLPIHVEETGSDGSTQGGGLQVSRTEIFNQINVEFSQASSLWPSLISSKPSMIFSPIFAASCGLIPSDFLQKSGWQESFMDLYSTHTLNVDMSESFPASEGGGIWQGLINPNTSVITFNRQVDDSHPKIDPVTLTLPQNIAEILSGSGPSWKITTSLQAALARNISCAIDTNTLSLSEPLCQAYFIKNKDQFYQINAELPKGLQFIDHYSKILHSFGDHKIYTLPYDDELNQSGAASYPKDQYVSGVIVLSEI